ncbi:hypothetical protein Dda_8042 [Drechslerella dactyloides]|uniref:Uncharacterized protein n=1 Tax=Drechslerella dactyloides TaxID=74499 RepID=A0AAD6NF61_DREDA|nr:hypothetical protein Dda_8042 [Drechslerella dactyloides]
MTPLLPPRPPSQLCQAGWWLFVLGQPRGLEVIQQRQSSAYQVMFEILEHRAFLEATGTRSNDKGGGRPILVSTFRGLDGSGRIVILCVSSPPGMNFLTSSVPPLSLDDDIKAI